MESLFTGARVTSISEPQMYWTIKYEYQRSGVNMQYRFNWNVYLGTSSGWYNDAMQIQLFLNGVQSDITVKPFQANNKGWNYSGTTGWYTVSNKTSGTTPFYAKLKDTSAGDVKATSSTYQLAIVPAASVLGTISNFDIDGSITIPITKYNTAYTDTLTIQLFEQNIKTISGITNGAKVVFTEAERTRIYEMLTKWNTGIFAFVLTTTSGSTTLGTSTKYADGSISNADPTFTESQITYNDSNTTIAAITGSTSSSPIIVKSKSTLAITYTAATGNKKATISKYEFTLDGVTKTSTSVGGTVSFGVINASKNLTLTAKVTDARGNSTTVTKTIVIEQYTKPTLSPYGTNTSIVCGRSTSAGVLDRNGTSLKISVKGNCFALSNGKNTGTLTVSGITSNPVTLDSTNYNKVVPNVTLALTSVYSLTIKCTDKFGEYAQATIPIPSQYVDFHLKKGGKGAAFGEYATENNVVSIAEDWKLKAKGGASMNGKKITDVATPTANTDAANKSYVDTLVSNLATSTASVGDTTDYVVAQGTSGIWTYRKWNSGISECWGGQDATPTTMTGYDRVYYFDTEVTFPTNLFVSGLMDVQATVYSKNGGLYWASPYNCTTAKAQMRVMGGDSAVRTSFIWYSIKGKWK